MDSRFAGGRWRWHHKTELDGDKWSVDHDTLEVKRCKSSQSLFCVNHKPDHTVV